MGRSLPKSLYSIKDARLQPKLRKPPAKNEAQIEPEAKTFAETKGKAEAGDADAQKQPSE